VDSSHGGLFTHWTLHTLDSSHTGLFARWTALRIAQHERNWIRVLATSEILFNTCGYDYAPTTLRLGKIRRDPSRDARRTGIGFQMPTISLQTCPIPNPTLNQHVTPDTLQPDCMFQTACSRLHVPDKHPVVLLNRCFFVGKAFNGVQQLIQPKRFVKHGIRPQTGLPRLYHCMARIITKARHQNQRWIFNAH